MVRCQRNSSSPKPIGDFTSENAPHSKGCACSRRFTPAKACRRVSRGLRHRLSPTLGGRVGAQRSPVRQKATVERRDHERHRFLRAVAPRQISRLPRLFAIHPENCAPLHATFLTGGAELSWRSSSMDPRSRKAPRSRSRRACARYSRRCVGRQENSGNVGKRD